MRQISPVLIAGLGAAALGGCGFNVKIPSPTTPVGEVSPPPPGQRRCVEIGEDIFGRKYCARYVKG